MNKNHIEEKELIALLEESKSEIPGKEFSNTLKKAIIENCGYKAIRKSPFEKYLGKFIIVFLVITSLLILYDLGTLSMDPIVLVSTFTFILGLWVSIAFLRRIGNSSLLKMAISQHEEQ